MPCIYAQWTLFDIRYAMGGSWMAVHGLRYMNNVVHSFVYEGVSHMCTWCKLAFRAVTFPRATLAKTVRYVHVEVSFVLYRLNFACACFVASCAVRPCSTGLLGENDGMILVTSCASKVHTTMQSAGVLLYLSVSRDVPLPFYRKRRGSLRQARACTQTLLALLLASFMFFARKE